MNIDDPRLFSVVMPTFENLLEDPIVMRTWVQAVARTAPGVDPARAAAALDAVLQADEERTRGPGQAAGKRPTGPRAKLVLTPATAVSALRRQFSRPLKII